MPKAMIDPPNNSPNTLSKKDFQAEDDVRWCPGCGDYSILAAVQKFLPMMGKKKEDFVFISGIGCSSRFPYYMNTYGFHGIHGRAPTLATGVKLANPNLDVWVITGDGDALSIGGNHIIHALRRNIDLVILLFNNRIYGLTKGQYSPTSKIGKVTKSTPHGSLDYPINPLKLALGSEGSFIARTLDVDQAHMLEVFKAATKHQGASFIEIYQNCIIFNDNAFGSVSDKKMREEHRILLKDGELMIFGKNRNKGIALDGFTPKVVQFSNEEEAERKGVIRCNSTDSTLANILASMEAPLFPIPMGVLYKNKRETLEDQVTDQIKASKEKAPIKDSVDDNLKELFMSGNTWTVK